MSDLFLSKTCVAALGILIITRLTAVVSLAETVTTEKQTANPLSLEKAAEQSNAEIPKSSIGQMGMIRRPHTSLDILTNCKMALKHNLMLREDFLSNNSMLSKASPGVPGKRIDPLYVVFSRNSAHRGDFPVMRVFLHRPVACRRPPCVSAAPAAWVGWRDWTAAFGQ